MPCPQWMSSCGATPTHGDIQGPFFQVSSDADKSCFQWAPGTLYRQIPTNATPLSHFTLRQSINLNLSFNRLWNRALLQTSHGGGYPSSVLSIPCDHRSGSFLITCWWAGHRVHSDRLLCDRYYGHLCKYVGIPLSNEVGIHFKHLLEVLEQFLA